jgi:hypothetical protein
MCWQFNDTLINPSDYSVYHIASHFIFLKNTVMTNSTPSSSDVSEKTDLDHFLVQQKQNCAFEVRENYIA